MSLETPLPTDEAVEAYFRDKLAQCHTVTNYGAVGISFYGYKKGGINSRFHVTLSDALVTRDGESLTIALAKAAKELETKPAHQILRERAAADLAKADELERKCLDECGCKD